MNKLSIEEYIDMLIVKLAKKYNISVSEAESIFNTSSVNKSFHAGDDYALYQMTRSYDDIIDEAYEENKLGLCYA